MSYLSPGSYWLQSPESAPLHFPTLDEDCHVDVAIIGAGITGLSAALALAQAGKQVAVLEAEQVGAGTTSGTSGHLDVAPDQGFVKLVRDFGEQAARDVTASRAHAIDKIEWWAAEFGIDCDFQRVAALWYAERAEGENRIQEEAQMARRLGVRAVAKPGAGLPFNTAAAMEIANQARIHSQKYLRGIAQAVHESRAAIYEHTRAEPPRDGSPCVVQAGDRRVVAQDVILATHSAYLGMSQFDTRQAAYQSYVMAVRVDEELHDALYWDDQQPYHYIRLAATDDPRLIIVGGADHKTGQGNPRSQLRELEQFVAERFTIVGVEHEWSSEFFEPSDGLPFIGRVPGADHLYLATGFSGTGLTYGIVAAQLLTELILNRPAPLAEIFSPARIKPLSAAKVFVNENANAAKHFVADRFSGEHAESLDVVKPGEGRLLKVNGDTYAVYRDEHNELHVCSPVCTHAGCYVQWNAVEKTWDCPCHGGRYSPTGERIYGPPAADLERKTPVGAH